MRGKTVLVAGGTGFLGGALARRLAKAGARVRVLARTPEKGETLRRDIDADIVVGDITQADSLRPAVEGCDAVFNVAVSYGSLREQRAVNVEGARSLALAARDAGVNRFVHVSTVAVYGFRIDGDITEAMPETPAPHTPYSVTKAEGERALRQTAGDRLAYTIIRPGMIYGPGSNPWTRRMFVLARMKPFLFPTQGHSSAFPIHVDDVTAMMLLLAEHPAAPGQAFHCAPDPAPTWRDFMCAYTRLAGHDTWIGLPLWLFRPFVAAGALVAPNTSPLKDAPDVLETFNRRITYTMDKSRRLLGWEPQIDLQTGIASTIPWLREQGLLP